MTPEQITQLGAIGVFLLVFAAAVRGDVQFRAGVDALRDALASERAGRARAEAHAETLVDAVDKLADALEARNRRDEQTRREP